MTVREEMLVVNFIASGILILLFGIIAGCFIDRNIDDYDFHDEQYYQKKSAEIYTLATDYLFEESKEIKQSKKIELLWNIRLYNNETKHIKNWKYRCPKSFTLEYLGVRDD